MAGRASLGIIRVKRVPFQGQVHIENVLDPAPRSSTWGSSWFNGHKHRNWAPSDGKFGPVTLERVNDSTADVGCRSVCEARHQGA